MSYFIYGKEIFTFIPYTDFNLWLVIFGLAVLFFILSRVREHANLIFSGLAFIFSIATMEGALTLARFDFVQNLTNESYVYNVGGNVSYITKEIVYNPAVISIANPWIIHLTRIFALIMFLNLIWTIAEGMIPKNEERVMQ